MLTSKDKTVRNRGTLKLGLHKEESLRYVTGHSLLLLKRSSENAYRYFFNHFKNWVKKVKSLGITYHADDF